MGNTHDQSQAPKEAKGMSSISSINMDDSKSSWMPSAYTSTRLRTHCSSISSEPTTVRCSRLAAAAFHVSTSEDTDTDTVSELPCSTTKSAMRRKSRRARHRKQQSSLTLIQNGITGKYISPRITRIAAKEIGCSIFFAMFSDDSMKPILQRNLRQKQQIEVAAMKYLDMFSWLIRHLIADNIDLYALLSKLGKMHQAMGVQINHFNPMLQAMHESFGYYFGAKYTIDVKYAFDEIFAVAAQIMTGQELDDNSHLMLLSKQFQGDTIPFLESVSACLQCDIGREYLYRYLQQMWCEEIVMFLKSLSRFKTLPSDTQRFIVARDIAKTCISSSGAFSLNLPHACRLQMMEVMKGFEEKFADKEPLEISVDLFESVCHSVSLLFCRYTMRWNLFCDCYIYEGRT